MDSALALATGSIWIPLGEFPLRNRCIRGESQEPNGVHMFTLTILQDKVQT